MFESDPQIAPQRAAAELAVSSAVGQVQPQVDRCSAYATIESFDEPMQ